MRRPILPALLVLLVTLVADIAVSAQGKSDAVDLAKFDAAIKPNDREHWSFVPLHKQSVPSVRDPSWVNNPIDAFVLASLEADKMRPAAPASPRAWLRRAYLDLTGLPPTPEEVERFVADCAEPTTSHTAHERIIDRLLASPRHGERWGRHWLDVVRYAETSGYERDAIKPSVWRYRDYVIRAFNDDKPFDRFLVEQLAGDELPDRTADTLIATGFLRLGPWDDEPADPKEDRFDQLDDMVNATSVAFLGLTLGCARCHNHKYDALTMHDYYRMVAVFAPLERPAKGRTELDAPLDLVARTVRDARAEGERKVPPDSPRGYFFLESARRPPDTHLLLRGKAARPGPKVDPGVPAVLSPRQPEFPAATERTSLRRLTLARWIAAQPLTARVIVNRVWQYHFGEGLVRSPGDFGVLGSPPTHPELLDWLASWFVDNGWSLKKLHRLILTSNAYRMSKTWNKDFARSDPENQRLWRFPYRRLEVEAIRDSILVASDRLNPRMYGPSMFPEVPKEALLGHSDPKVVWKASDEDEAARRTVYAHIKRSLVVPLLEVLDLCDSTRPSDKRLVTTVAPQALTLFNGDFVNRQARHLAHRIAAEAGDDPQRQIDRAYRLTLCRPPTPRESTYLADFLDRETQALVREGTAESEARQRALEQMCRIVFNLNEFVYPD